VSNPQHVPGSLASNTKRDGVNVAVSAAAVVIAVVAAVKLRVDGPAVQASRGTVAWSDLLYDDEEDRWYSRLSHSVSSDDGPQYYRWQWAVMVPQRHPRVKVHLDGGSTARTLPSAASHPGEVVVTCRRPSRTVCWEGTTRRVVWIDAVERTAPAMRRVVVPAEHSGALV
jgi:hypothetical protein